MEDDYYFVVFDEARYLVDVNTVYDSELITIKTEYKPSEEEFWKECWEKLDEMVFPSTDYIVEKGIGWCYWFKRVLSEKMMAKEWFENLNEIDKSYYAYADTDYYLEYRKLLYNEELQKWQFEYWGFQGDPNFPEYPDEYIHQLDREIIRKKLYEVVRNLDRNNAEMLKSAKCLSILYQIAGSYSVEIEIMDKNPFSQKEGEYGIYLKAYRQQQIPRGEINVYIDATPYPDEFINYWLRVQPEELNIVTIPSSVRVIIAYTNNKKTISGLKSWRNLIPHAGILLFLKESVERMGKTLLLVARNTRIAKMLGRKGVTNILRTYYPQLDVHPIKPKIICGGRGSEGVQEDVDIVILEGPQIKKPESGISKKFEIGRALNQFDSMKAHYLLHQIENCQNMVQAMCRGIDREEKRSNVIVLLGNKMPYEKKSFELPWGI
ncbi:MAG TPA: hypothetical protein ENI33_07475 [Thermoplasmatales archaeon]|nr:hypothetical protein [Thermoplasmatales archaeon]